MRPLLLLPRAVRVSLIFLSSFAATVTGQTRTELLEVEPLGSACSGERWAVKSGTDAGALGVDLSATSGTTISDMRGWNRPDTLPEANRVAPRETALWTLYGTLTAYRFQDDSDYHLVIADRRGNTIITEIPDPACVPETSPFARAIAAARAKFDARFSVTTSFQYTSTAVRITGAGFFDHIKGQMGVAPNGIEIHPVLDIQFDLPAVRLEVPVVLDVLGVSPAHFTSDLVAVNRSGASSRVSLQYVPAPGTPGAGGPAITREVASGRELRIRDVVSYLRANGYALPSTGTPIVGNLLVTFAGVTDPAAVFAGTRASTPNPNVAVGGSFGLFASAIPTASATSTTATIYALREDAAFRSNLAVVDVPGGSGPAVLSIQLVDGVSGLPAGAPIAYPLQAGEWKQFGSILGLRSLANGYAIVSRIGGGTNRFIVYGVLNDGGAGGGGTSDGSYLGSDASSGLIPIVLRVAAGSGAFTSELVLANPTAAAIDAMLTYTPAAAFLGGRPLTTTVPLGAGQQVRIPDVIAYLRDVRGLPLPSGDVNQGGTLAVSNAVALARTSNPNPDVETGGTFGLAYPAVADASRAKSEAWIYGLVQDSSSRSNVAIADARVGSHSTVSYMIDVYDAILGNGIEPALVLGPFRLVGGDWVQVSGILAQAGLSSGYVRVRPETGSSDFIAYGVLNDGAAPGSGTSDGSYIPMAGAR